MISFPSTIIMNYTILHCCVTDIVQQILPLQPHRLSLVSLRLSLCATCSRCACPCICWRQHARHGSRRSSAQQKTSSKPNQSMIHQCRLVPYTFDRFFDRYVRLVEATGLFAFFHCARAGKCFVCCVVSSLCFI